MEVDEKTMKALLHRIEVLENAQTPESLRTYYPDVWYPIRFGKCPGECPVDGEALVDVELSNGEIKYIQVAAMCSWWQETDEAYVVCFRLLSSVYTLGVWNDWSGGKCPSTKDVPTLVDIELRSGEVITSVHTGYHHWHHRNIQSDIVRFRMVTAEEELERKEAEGRPTKETRAWYAWNFQRDLGEIFKDGPPDSSFGDSSPPSQPRSGGPFGCQPGQFVDRPSWRDW